MSENDRMILRSLEAFVESTGRLFGKHGEVVLHSLEDLDHSIIAIANGQVTGRSKGGPMTDFALSLLKEIDKGGDREVLSYFSSTRDGRKLKSSTTIVRNAKGKPIGMLCINLDISAPAEELLSDLFGIGAPAPGIEEHYPQTARDLIELSLKEAVAALGNERGLAPSERNKAVVEVLYRKGIFNVKNGVDIVAEDLGISRYTVYNYIREVKMKIDGPVRAR